MYGLNDIQTRARRMHQAAQAMRREMKCECDATAMSHVSTHVIGHVSSQQNHLLFVLTQNQRD